MGSLSVSVQTSVTPGPNCSMQAMTTASCSSSVNLATQGASAASTASASYGDLFGHTQSGGSIIYGTFVAFGTSFSEMLTIGPPNGATGTLISRFELLIMAQSDALFGTNPKISVGIHQGQATYDSGLASNISQEVVVTSAFQFGVPFVFSAEMLHSWHGCCTDSQGSLGMLQFTSFTVLDADNRVLSNALIANDHSRPLNHGRRQWSPWACSRWW